MPDSTKTANGNQLIKEMLAQQFQVILESRAPVSKSWTIAQAHSNPLLFCDVRNITMLMTWVFCCVYFQMNKFKICIKKVNKQR